MIAIDLVQHLVNMAALPFTSYFFPPCVRLLLGLPRLGSLWGCRAPPFVLALFPPSFSLVSRHSGAQWDLPMYIGSSPIANYLQQKRSFSSPWSLS